MSYYNHKQYLIDSIHSLINQTYKDWKLFLLNDDPSFSLEKYCLFDNRIYIQSCSSNLGQSSRFNQGLAHTETEFVTFHGCDDLSDSNRFEICLNHLKHLDILYTDAIYFNNKEQSYYQSKRWDRIKYKEGNYITAGSVIYRTELATKFEFNESLRYGEDWDYLYRVSEFTDRIDYLPLPLFRYRTDSSVIKVRNNPLKAKIKRMLLRRKF